LRSPSPRQHTRDRIDAIDALNGAFNTAPYWRDVENFLYHQLFAWPLLVSSDAKAAFSLPISIDLDPFEARKPIVIRGGTVIPGPPFFGVDVEGWKKQLTRVATAARVLWRGKHGNYGSFIDDLLETTVAFDFRTADAIVAGFPELFSLTQSSMEAYLSGSSGI
jgi:hypothetical protein